jgi:pimeloyl-ACP methyl ester carboxylesterase
MHPDRTCSLVLTALLLAGCASSTSRDLREIADVPDLAALCARKDALGKRTSRFPTAIDDGPVVNLALHEIGHRTAGPTYVMIHGVKSNHHMWQFVVGELGDTCNMVLVDLPGCGDSDRPDPARLGPGGYSPDALAERVLQALGGYLAQRADAPRITLVGHSLGGAIAIRMMASPDHRSRYDAVIRHVDRMVLFAPADVEIVSPSPVLMKLAALSGLEVAIADLFGILRMKVEGATRESVVDPARRAIREEADKTCEILRNSDTRLALQAMLLQAVPRRPGGDLDWERIDTLTAQYANVDVPCLIVWGRYDETLEKALGYKLAAQIARGTGRQRASHPRS